MSSNFAVSNVCLPAVTAKYHFTFQRIFMNCRYAAYGATKRAMPQLTASLAMVLTEPGLNSRLQVRQLHTL
jgi:NAD(P)-dependent dehydrogenase (short-subunit alcohol dehydrogenase family)